MDHAYVSNCSHSTKVYNVVHYCCLIILAISWRIIIIKTKCVAVEWGNRVIKTCASKRINKAKSQCRTVDLRFLLQTLMFMHNALVVWTLRVNLSLTHHFASINSARYPENDLLRVNHLFTFPSVILSGIASHANSCNLDLQLSTWTTLTAGSAWLPRRSSAK